VPLFTPEQRAEVQSRLSGLLRADDCIVEVVPVGSTRNGQMDRYSDLDLVALVADTADHHAVAADWTSRMYDAFPVLHHFEVALGDTLFRGFLLDNLLEVDLGFEPVSRFEIFAELPVPGDHAGNPGLLWHDVVHAGIAAERGQPWTAELYLQRIRNRGLAIAAERRGLRADFFKEVDALPDEVTTAFAQTLAARLDQATLRSAIRQATELAFAELRAVAPELAQRLEAPLLTFLDELAG
jgi:hypothetical protein